MAKSLFLCLVSCAWAYGLILPPELLEKSKVERKKLPAVVPLYDKTGVVCTGVFIGERVVLTAAHCIAKGERLLLQFGTALHSVKLTPHPGAKFNKGWVGKDYDVALGWVEKPMAYAKPTPLAVEGHAQVGDEIALAGYGCTIVGKKRPEGILRKASFGIDEFVEPHFNVTAPGKSSACFGDSGGPALQNHRGRLTVVGVISAGFPAGVSWVIDLSSVEMLNFLKSFAEEHHTSICGVDKGC